MTYQFSYYYSDFFWQITITQIKWENIQKFVIHYFVLNCNCTFFGLLSIIMMKLFSPIKKIWVEKKEDWLWNRGKKAGVTRMQPSSTIRPVSTSNWTNKFQILIHCIIRWWAELIWWRFWLCKFRLWNNRKHLFIVRIENV